VHRDRQDPQEYKELEAHRELKGQHLTVHLDFKVPKV
jgi:hypothetical protein